MALLLIGCALIIVTFGLSCLLYAFSESLDGIPVPVVIFGGLALLFMAWVGLTLVMSGGSMVIEELWKQHDAILLRN